MTIALGAVVLAAAGIAGAAAYLQSRDDATVASDPGAGRLRLPGAQPAVRPGNVLLLYADARHARQLRALRRELGDSGPALEAAGQALTLRRDGHLRVPIVALSTRHRQDAASASEPAVRDFVEYWLGRATG